MDAEACTEHLLGFPWSGRWTSAPPPTAFCQRGARAVLGERSSGLLCPPGCCQETLAHILEWTLQGGGHDRKEEPIGRVGDGGWVASWPVRKSSWRRCHWRWSDLTWDERGAGRCRHVARWVKQPTLECPAAHTEGQMEGWLLCFLLMHPGVGAAGEGPRVRVLDTRVSLV